MDKTWPNVHTQAFHTETYLLFLHSFGVFFFFCTIFIFVPSYFLSFSFLIFIYFSYDKNVSSPNIRFNSLLFRKSSNDWTGFSTVFLVFSYIKKIKLMVFFFFFNFLQRRIGPVPIIIKKKKKKNCHEKQRSNLADCYYCCFILNSGLTISGLCRALILVNTITIKDKLCRPLILYWFWFSLAVPY